LSHLPYRLLAGVQMPYEPSAVVFFSAIHFLHFF